MASGSHPGAIYSSVRGRILSGELEAGSPLRQAEIAGRAGTSRIPVREALRRLEAEGLVTYEPRRGAVVASLSPADVQEMLEIRIALECRALRLALPNLVGSDFDLLEEILDAYDTSDDPAAWSRLNLEFHAALYAPADRPRLLALIEANVANVDRFVRARISRATGREQPQREHRMILRACRAGDPDRAAGLLERHIAHTQKLVAAAGRGGGRPR